MGANRARWDAGAPWAPQVVADWGEGISDAVDASGYGPPPYRLGAGFYQFPPGLRGTGGAGGSATVPEALNFQPMWWSGPDILITDLACAVGTAAASGMFQVLIYEVGPSGQGIGGPLYVSPEVSTAVSGLKEFTGLGITLSPGLYSISLVPSASNISFLSHPTSGWAPEQPGVFSRGMTRYAAPYSYGDTPPVDPVFTTVDGINATAAASRVWVFAKWTVL
jgi:hypothetical protein